MLYVLALWAVTFIAVGTARAGSPGAWDNACTGDLDVATCERVQYVAENMLDSTTAIDAHNSLHDDAWMVAGVVAGTGIGVMVIRGLFGRG